MAPSPGGIPAHKVCWSARQIATIVSARRGSIGRTGPSGGNPGAAAVGLAGAAAAGFGADLGPGATVGFGAAEAGGAAAGVGIAAEGVAAGAAGAGAGAGGATIAPTAVLQAPESLAEFRERHSIASLPPGVTPEQFAMKSDRQDWRTALI
jgi:hypothetical protein